MKAIEKLILTFFSFLLFSCGSQDYKIKAEERASIHMKGESSAEFEFDPKTRHYMRVKNDLHFSYEYTFSDKMFDSTTVNDTDTLDEKAGEYEYYTLDTITENEAVLTFHNKSIFKSQEACVIEYKKSSVYQFINGTRQDFENGKTITLKLSDKELEKLSQLSMEEKQYFTCMFSDYVDKKNSFDIEGNVISSEITLGKEKLKETSRLDYSFRFVSSNLLKGQVMLASDDYSGSLFEFDKAIELNPKSTIAYIARAEVKLGLEDNKGAIKDCNKAIELEPQKSQAYSIRASANVALENYNEAIQDCNTAIKLDPKSKMAYLTRASVKLAINDKKGAVNDCNNAIYLDSSHAQAYYMRGMIKILINKPDACNDLAKAAKLGYDKANEKLLKYCK